MADWTPTPNTARRRRWTSDPAHRRRFRAPVDTPGSLVILAVAVAGLLVGGCAGGGRPEPDPMGAGSGHPLQAEITSRLDSTGTFVPLVRVQVPYRSLVFVRQDTAWSGGILVQVTARRGDERIGGGVASVQARVADPAAPGEHDLVCEVPLTLRGEKPVVLDVVVTATETSRRWQRRLDLNPGPLVRLPLIVRSVEWNPPPRDNDVHLDRRQNTLTAVVTVTLRPGPAPPEPPRVELRGTVQARADDAAARQRIAVSLPATAADTTAVRLSWATRDLPFGRSDLRLDLILDGDTETGVPCAPGRELVNLQVAWWDDRAWRRHVTWLEGLVGEEERDRLRDLAPAARAAAWDGIWRAAAARGTGPRELESEHLTRIVTADDRFGRFGRGALSDRGRALIRYGEPDHVERRNDDLSRESRWEIWYYRGLNLRLSFMDRHGLDDFRLVETAAP